MSPSSDQRVADFYAQTYDASVPDWPGEIEFYRGLASEVRLKGRACSRSPAEQDESPFA